MATIIGSFASPSTIPIGLTWTGSELISSDMIITSIYIHSGLSSTLTGSFASPSTNPTGLAWTGSELISSDYSKDHIYIHSGLSSTLTGSFASPSTNPIGLTWTGSELISADNGTNHIYIHSGLSSTLTGSFASPSTNPTGLTWTGSELISADYDTDHIYIIDISEGPTTFTITPSDSLTLNETVTASLTGVTVFTATPSDSLNLGETVTPIHTQIKETFTISITDSLTLGEDITVSLVSESTTFTTNPIDSLTLNETVTVIYTQIKETFTVSITDSLNLHEGISYPETAYNIKTKIEIEGTEYSDYKNLQVKKAMSNYNSSSSFSLRLDSPFGRHKSDFTVGNEIVIYAQNTKNTPTTKLLTGIIEKIKFNGSGTYQEVILSGRDYSARLQDASIEPSVFTDSEVSTIVTNLIQNFVSEVTFSNVNVTSTTLERIAFRHTSVFDAISELAELSSSFWYVDTDKDLHFEQKDSVSSGFTLDNTNILSTNYEQTREGMVNDVWVYGDKYLSGYEEVLTGDGGSVFTLLNRPHNTSLNYLGSPYKGGIWQLTSTPISGIEYYVNYFDRELIFISGTDLGYSSIITSGGSVVANYDREIPIVRHERDKTSIANYGKRTKVIQDDAIKDPTTATNIAAKEILKSDPMKGLEVDFRGWKDLVPGQTIRVTLDNFNIDNIVGILNVDYNFTAERIRSNKVIKIRLDTKILDITDQIKELSNKVKKLESRSIVEQQTTTRYEEYDSDFSVVGSYWKTQKRTIGSSFMLGHLVNGILGSPAVSVVGSQLALGDSRGVFSIMTSGGET